MAKKLRARLPDESKLAAETRNGQYADDEAGKQTAQGVAVRWLATERAARNVAKRSSKRSGVSEKIVTTNYWQLFTDRCFPTSSLPQSCAPGRPAAQGIFPHRALSRSGEIFRPI